MVHAARMFARVKRAFAPPDEELERAKRAAEVDASAFREVDESRAQKVVRPACAVAAASRTRFRELRTASDVSRDVEVFACAAGADDGTPCVFDVLNSRCASLGGKQCLRAVLGRPLLDGELLRARVSGLRRVHARRRRCCPGTAPDTDCWQSAPDRPQDGLESPERTASFLF